MALKVPPEQIVYIKKFLELPDEKVNEFLAALTNVGPQFNIFDLSKELSNVVDVSPELTEGVTRVLTAIYLSRNLGKSIEEFVDREVYPSLKIAKAFSPQVADAQWRKLRTFLIAALSLERTVGTTAKAGRVLTQHERIFDGARMMTDLRPIYHLDVSETPDAAVIIHMLRITQRDNLGNKSELYFALDSNDVDLMRKLFERAVKKEQTLRRVMKDSGMVVLDPKLIF